MKRMERLRGMLSGFVLVALVTGCSTAGTASPSSDATASPAVTLPPSMAPVTPAPPTATPVASAAFVLYDRSADPRADIEAALALAKADGKRVLLDFGADWCPDCHVLAAYLDGDAGRKLVDDSFHVVSIDVGYWDHNLDVAKTYGSPITTGIPAVVVLTADGKIVGSTGDGSLASASTMTESDVLTKLAAWAD
jgi:thiol:disulfide interchange protein